MLRYSFDVVPQDDDVTLASAGREKACQQRLLIKSERVAGKKSPLAPFDLALSLPALNNLRQSV